MLSAVLLVRDRSVPVPPSPEAIVRSLASLVPAAIEGLVRDVVLAGPAGDRDLEHIADHAGCNYVEVDDPSQIIRAGMAAARGDTLLILRAGLALERGFIEELADLSHRMAIARAVRLRGEPESFATRLLPGLAPAVGLVAVRSTLDPAAPDLATLIRRARPSATFRARLRRV